MEGAGEDLELLFHAEKSNFLSRNDALVLALHGFLLDEGYRCVGKNEEWPKDEIKGNKTLPQSWNEDQEKISLRYVKKEIKILLSVFADADNTMITVQDVNLAKTEGICLDVESYVNNTYETFNSTYKNLEELKQRLVKEVLEPLAKLHTSNIVPQREPPRSRLEDDYRLPPLGAGHLPNLQMPFRPSPFDYGRSDLDPFGGGGGMGTGGMLFDIPRPNRNPQVPGYFPRGSVPPGARFDPIGPSTGMPMPRRGVPDPDVGLPPPGYDDMFY